GAAGGQAGARAVGRARGAGGEVMQEYAFHRALAAIWEFVAVVNRYVDSSAPWELKKDPAKQPRLDAVLYVLAESLRCLGIVLAPFIPDAAEKIRAAVGQTAAPTVAEAVWGRLAAGAGAPNNGALPPRGREQQPAAAAGR